MCLSLKPTMTYRSQGASPKGPGIVISKVITPVTPALLHWSVAKY